MPCCAAWCQPPHGWFHQTLGWHYFVCDLRLTWFFAPEPWRPHAPISTVHIDPSIGKHWKWRWNLNSITNQASSSRDWTTNRWRFHAQQNYNCGQHSFGAKNKKSRANENASQSFNEILLSVKREHDEIIVVSDTYEDSSLKNSTREVRGHGRAAVQYQINDTTRIKHISVRLCVDSPKVR